MKQIWAPWRMRYIMGKKKSGCFFCKNWKDTKDRENYILSRGKSCFIILNIYPYNNGHLMVVPARHVPSLDGLDEKELLELMVLTRKAIKLLKEALHPHGFNVGMNLGEAAGAGVKDHLHLHIVPRWTEDTNFMPVISETKVIPELLRDTYHKLRENLDRF
ncbi:HIT domain-containing protein [candidate division NPL-UPA2 bacterium]|nr:HIT domain-containing protein [candidate division NPL-UPA2 bacterium]